MCVLTVRAPAKLNLYLHIQGKRADGYHLLESLVAFADLADEIHIEPASELRFVMEGEFAVDASNGERNLVLKAAHLLQKKTHTLHGAALRLVKNIPVGAGLGGGSADAAATLRALNDFWQLRVPLETLQGWAKELGADVAMCVASVPAIARGVGDDLMPLGPLPPIHLVLVHPRVPLLTADVYAAYASGRLVAGKGNGPAASAEIQAYEIDVAASLPQLLDLLQNTGNDLQQPAIQVSPVVAQVLLALETLTPAPSMVRMTGSGACCFAIYESAEAAERASNHLKTEHPFWWVRQAFIGA